MDDWGREKNRWSKIETVMKNLTRAHQVKVDCNGERRGTAAGVHVDGGQSWAPGSRARGDRGEEEGGVTIRSLWEGFRAKATSKEETERWFLDRSLARWGG
ncbi:uncharacterized protein PV07_08246 [Cladophialophora immunda]|uniref:Uncharacterized protein n=1 Tax=Cladophialophora immunda TaxID=569365 RepID=A0A0D2CYE3_9EURO|nr:uncharacterized protein PV07_08246 [Cladophialophora immunda]KIW28594.1 hypothetical protein PV07_08246 [Cladophialophora immunda]